MSAKVPIDSGGRVCVCPLNIDRVGLTRLDIVPRSVFDLAVGREETRHGYWRRRWWWLLWWWWRWWEGHTCVN